MASRRMFSCSLLTSDRYLEMSHAARGLYVLLCVSADDDGFVNSPAAVMRLSRTKQQHMQELENAGFLIFFPSRVAVITHWHCHNQIRMDCYHPTVYTEEWNELLLTESGEYVLSEQATPEQRRSAEKREKKRKGKKKQETQDEPAAQEAETETETEAETGAEAETVAETDMKNAEFDVPETKRKTQKSEAELVRRRNALITQLRQEKDRKEKLSLDQKIQDQRRKDYFSEDKTSTEQPNPMQGYLAQDWTALP